MVRLWINVNIVWRDLNRARCGSDWRSPLAFEEDGSRGEERRRLSPESSAVAIKYELSANNSETFLRLIWKGYGQLKANDKFYEKSYFCGLHWGQGKFLKALARRAGGRLSSESWSRSFRSATHTHTPSHKGADQEAQV